jgi:hypothetical protein
MMYGRNNIWPLTRKIYISSVYTFKGEKFGQRKTEQFCIMKEKGVQKVGQKGEKAKDVVKMDF